MSANINVAIIGAGRIGRMHAEVILKEIPQAQLKVVFDKYKKKDWLKKITNQKVEVTDDLKKIIDDDEIEAVIIASSTTSHVPLIKELLRTNPVKHIFCEKPVALSSKDFSQLLSAFKGKDFVFQVGYNRRHDPQFLELKKGFRQKKVGKPYLLKIINRDPVRPPVSFIPKSGGMIFDFNTHDFDMVNFLLGEKIKEVTAFSANLVDPKIGELGDIDTVLISLRMESGALVNIDCSREASYGYDQQIEILGSKGSIKATNLRENSLMLSTKAGVSIAKPKFDFVARYQEAFINQSKSFFDSIKRSKNSKTVANQKITQENTIREIENAKNAISVAEAVTASLKTKKVVAVKY